jgi:hypothetical protein
MSMSDSGANGTEALAAPAPQVDDVPPSGQVPAHILQNGGQARIPLWPIHADELGESDVHQYSVPGLSGKRRMLFYVARIHQFECCVGYLY